jgi:hypothetical protein
VVQSSAHSLASTVILLPAFNPLGYSTAPTLVILFTKSTDNGVGNIITYAMAPFQT